ncbi:MAG: S24 family peptidase, partial [Pirellulales bacterium]
QPTTIEKSVSLRAKFSTHVPVYDLVAAASEWGSESSPDEVGWACVEGRNLSQGMFVAKVVGRSMEPKIPSGSWCLFGPCPAGTRQNRLLLMQASTHLDPEDGGRYTVKQYRSKKRVTDEDWEHEAIELLPLNPEYQPIQISVEDSDQIRVIGEFLSVVG